MKRQEHEVFHPSKGCQKVCLSRVRIKKNKESHCISVKIYVKKASVLQLLEHLDSLPISCPFMSYCDVEKIEIFIDYWQARTYEFEDC